MLKSVASKYNNVQNVLNLKFEIYMSSSSLGYKGFVCTLYKHCRAVLLEDSHTEISYPSIHPSYPSYMIEHSKPFYGDLKLPKADQAGQCRPRKTKADPSRPRQTKAAAAKSAVARPARG